MILKLIDDLLKKENKYHIHYNLIEFEKNLLGDFKYFLNCLKQLVEYKKSALIIINDNNYVISHCKPQGTKVLQVWHACGAIKNSEMKLKGNIQLEIMMRSSAMPRHGTCICQIVWGL